MVKIMPNSLPPVNQVKSILESGSTGARGGLPWAFPEAKSGQH